MEKKKINVLIVEDSLTAQHLLKGILASDPDFNLVGIVTNGRQAVEAVSRLLPDVVSMDVNMPLMDGLEATRQIMKENPVPIVIVSSLYETSNLSLSFSILKAGALTILPRPFGPGHPEYLASSRHYRNTLKLMAGIKFPDKGKRESRNIEPPKVLPSKVKDRQTPGSNEYKIVAIGASAGGPQALQAILSQIPSSFKLPILIVQHIDPNFQSGFCEWLNSSSGIPVSIASDKEMPLPGHAYLPPGNSHLGVYEEGCIHISQEPPEANHRPSVNHLFRSVNRVFANQTIAVLLSGMGTDGAKELKLLKAVGALTIVQDQESSLVHGMPGEAIRLGAASVVKPLNHIAMEIINSQKTS
jgi:two-component system chemotaxis response regulator CheB